MQIEIPRMLTMKQAAEETGLAYNAIRQLCKQRKIVYVQSGNKYYVNAKKLVEYLDKGDVEDG